jgi:hypothetical protein
MAKNSRLAPLVFGLVWTGIGLVFSWGAIEKVRSIQRVADLETIAHLSFFCGAAMIVLPQGILLLMVSLLNYRGRWAGHVYVLLVFNILQVLSVLCVGVGLVCFFVSQWGAR